MGHLGRVETLESDYRTGEDSARRSMGRMACAQIALRPQGKVSARENALKNDGSDDAVTHDASRVFVGGIDVVGVRNDVSLVLRRWNGRARCPGRRQSRQLCPEGL